MPVDYVSGSQDPANIEPVSHEPASYEPVIHEPVSHEPASYEPVIHEPVIHEPVIHEPVIHEPVIHEPVIHEPVNYVPASYEPVIYEPVSHESVSHETVSQEPNETTKKIWIGTIEHIMFGPDMEQYNAGLDSFTRERNELTLNDLAQTLIEHPEFGIRIEGHANPVTNDPDEEEELISLSRRRAEAVAGQLRAKGVHEGQIVLAALGGAKTITSDYEIRNKNRRVELTVIQVDT
jgi:outer membrane protein OmpA-like peptidoglycan-associated protein